MLNIIRYFSGSTKNLTPYSNTTATEVDSAGFRKVVGKRSRKDTVTGQRIASDIFKGVTKTLDIYVGRCESAVNCDILKSYIETDIKITVLDCECVSPATSSSKSFKVTVSAVDRDRLLDATLWPVDICVRKFFKYKSNGITQSNRNH